MPKLQFARMISIIFANQMALRCDSRSRCDFFITDGIELQFVQKFTDQTMTSVAADDPWYKAFMKAADKHNLEIAPRIFPAATDSRYLREVGIPALGFSPMNNTPVLLHDHNEFLNENVFMKGIDIFVDVVAEMASV